MLRNLCRGLAALAALALLLAGLPAVLALGTLAVTRHADPQHTGLVDLLTRPDNGNLFLWTLVVVGWIGWLCFAASVLVEIPAQLRGRSARRVFALGWSQRMAGGLVGAVLALLPTAGAALAASPAAVTSTVGLHAPVAVAAADHGGPAGAVAVGAPGTTRTPSRPTYRVREERPAESLWSIAEKELGSGPRWKEIARLNEGRTMDASGRRFDADRPIQPGWELLMPADAASATAGHSPQTAPRQTSGDHRTEVVVAAGDTLSELAQKELGSANQWPELFAANKGVRAPDGVRLENPDLIEPGMVLTVPQHGAAAPPVTPPVAPPATPPATPPHGAGPPAASAPAGGTSSHAPTATPQPSGTRAGAPASGGAHPSHPAPSHAAPTQHASAPTTVSAVPPAAPPTQVAAPAPVHRASAASGVEEGLIGGTALLAAVVLGAVAVRRTSRPRTQAPRRQAHQRPRTDPTTGNGSATAALPASLLEPVPPPFAALNAAAGRGDDTGPGRSDDFGFDGGGTVPPDEAGVAFLAAMSARQDTAGLDLLDRALRSLARTATAEGRRLPSLTVVRITPAHTVELHLATPAPPIEPFRAAHASTVWWCTPDSDQLLDARDAAAVPAPYPALVSLGTAAEGSIILVDLEAVRLVHLSGEPKAVTEVLRTLALELAFTPLADQVTVHTVGVGEELAPAAEGRLRVHHSLQDAVAAVSARDQQVRGALAEAGASTPREARSRGAAGAAWAPEIVLCATVPEGTMPEELGRMLDASPRGSVAVVASAPPPGAGPMARWTLPTTGPATLPGLGMSVELQHLNDHQYLQWLGLLGTAPDAPGQGPDVGSDVGSGPEQGGPAALRPVSDDLSTAASTGPSSVPPGLAARPEPRPDPHVEAPVAAPAPQSAAARIDPRFDIAPALDPWAVRSPWPDPASVEIQDAAGNVEAAHELTLRRLRAGDHQGAEAAAFAGLTPAPDTELLHRDLLCVYADAGATEQLHKAVHRLERLAARNGRALEPETDALIAELRGTGGAA